MKKIKVILSIIVTIFLLLINSQEINAQKFNPDDIIGKWYTDDKEAIVQIYKKKNDKYYGKFLWLIDEKDENNNFVKDKKNPDKSLRNRTVKEIEFIIGFIYDDGAYEDGVMYNYTDGNTYTVTMKLSGINTLKVRGYLLFEWLGRTVVWTRKIDVKNE